MPVSFEQLEVGEEYERPFLADLWGYISWEAIGRGIVTPADAPYIVLFVTKEKQNHLPQYQDELIGKILVMEREVGHVNDHRLAEAENSGYSIQLFHRELHHSPFVYYGEIRLLDYAIKSNQPSKFVFQLLS